MAQAASAAPPRAARQTHRPAMAAATRVRYQPLPMEPLMRAPVLPQPVPLWEVRAEPPAEEARELQRAWARRSTLRMDSVSRRAARAAESAASAARRPAPQLALPLAAAGLLRYPDPTKPDRRQPRACDRPRACGFRLQAEAAAARHCQTASTTELADAWLGPGEPRARSPVQALRVRVRLALSGSQAPSRGRRPRMKMPRPDDRSTPRADRPRSSTRPAREDPTPRLPAAPVPGQPARCPTFRQAASPRADP